MKVVVEAMNKDSPRVEYLYNGTDYPSETWNPFSGADISEIYFEFIYRVKAKPFTIEDAKKELLGLIKYNFIEDYGKRIDEILSKLSSSIEGE